VLERPESFGISNVELLRFYAPVQRRWYWADRALTNFRERKRYYRKRQRRAAHDLEVYHAKQRRDDADRSAIAYARLEGRALTSRTAALVSKLIEGEITIDQALKIAQE
jgi:hypothetical protein